jgi:hypothetical protein
VKKTRVDCRRRHQSPDPKGLDRSTSAHEWRNRKDCNGTTAPLARVAKNAVVNGDFPSAIAILDELASIAAAAVNPKPHGSGRSVVMNQRTQPATHEPLPTSTATSAPRVAAGVKRGNTWESMGWFLRLTARLTFRL